MNASEAEHDFIAASTAMREALRLMLRAIEDRVHTVVVGPTGSGKDCLVHAAWARGPHRDRPLLRFNSAAYPETLQKAALLGSRRGSYTGSREDVTGDLERAHGGALLLSDAQDMGRETQGTLRDYADHRLVRKIGDGMLRRSDVQLIVTTYRDPEELSRSGVLAEDVLERLEEFVVRVPPLRERREDIAPLVRYFLRRLSARFGRDISDLDADAWRFVLTYDWARNVRQLKNVLVQAAVDRPASIICFDAIWRALIARGLEPTEQIGGAAVRMIAKPASAAAHDGTNGDGGLVTHAPSSNGNGHMSDEMWSRIEPLIAECDPIFGRGLPPVEQRRIVERLVLRVRTGIAWRSLGGTAKTWTTVYRISKRWERSGLLTLIKNVIVLHGCQNS
jgi:DNA-binding NtrC family response regulator